MKHIPQWVIWVTFLALLLLAICLSRAGSVSLAWDPSPGADEFYQYRVYWGVDSRTYTNGTAWTTNLFTTVTNLAGGTTYYFTATAQDRWGFESDYSAEVSTLVPYQDTNIVSVPVTIQTNSRIPGVWGDWITFTVKLTNPPPPLYFRARMGISATNTTYRLFWLDWNTLGIGP